MTERRIGQLSFADGLVSEAAGGNAKLERIAGLIDWGQVAGLLRGLRGASPMGAPSYPALPLFKALVLQRWYGLSDPALEEALADRLSFRRFVGLSLSEQVPDHSTLWRFREELGKSGRRERSSHHGSDRGSRLSSQGPDRRQSSSAAPAPGRPGAEPTQMGGGQQAGAAIETRTRRPRRQEPTLGYKAHPMVRKPIIPDPHPERNDTASRSVRRRTRGYADKAYDNTPRPAQNSGSSSSSTGSPSNPHPPPRRYQSSAPHRAAHQTRTARPSLPKAPPPSVPQRPAPHAPPAGNHHHQPMKTLHPQ